MGLATLEFLHLNDLTMRGRCEHLVALPPWQHEVPMLGLLQGLHRFLNAPHPHAFLLPGQCVAVARWHLREGQCEPTLHLQSRQYCERP